MEEVNPVWVPIPLGLLGVRIPDRAPREWSLLGPLLFRGHFPIYGWACEFQVAGSRVRNRFAKWGAARLDCLDGTGQTIVRNLHTGFLAGLAESVNLELVPGRPKAVPLGDPGFDLLDLPALKLDDPPAFQTDQVLVHWLLGKAVFVSFEPLSEIMLQDQPAPNEEVQSPVDGSLSDPSSRGSEASLDFFNR